MQVFTHTRFDLEVKVEYSTSAANYGPVVFAIMLPDVADVLPTIPTLAGNAASLGSFPLRKIVNASGSGEMMFRVPYVARSPLVKAVPALQVTDRFANYPYCQLYVGGITLYTSCSETTPTAFTYTVWARAINIELAGADDWFTAGLESEVAEMKPSGVVGAVGAAADALSTVPVIGGVAGFVSRVAKAGSTVLKALGFSRPEIGNYMTPARSVPYNAADQPDYTTPMSVQTTLVAPVAADVLGGSGSDQLSLAYIGGIPSVVGVATWAQTAAPETTVLRVPVHPSIGGDTSGAQFMCSNGGFAFLPFAQWRADMHFRLTAYGSIQHNGRLRVVYHSTMGTTVGASSVGAAPLLSMDLSQARCAEFVVPFGEPSGFLPYRNTSPYGSKNGVLAVADYVRPLSSSTSLQTLTDNGYFDIIVDHALVAPIAGKDVVLVLEAWLEKPVARMPMASATRYLEFVSAGAEAEVVVDGDCCVAQQLGERFNILEPSQVGSGEGLVSLRPLMKRYEFSYWLPSGAPDATAYALASFYHNAPVRPTNRVAKSTGYPDLYGSVISVYMRAFMGYSGSIRLKFINMNPGGPVRRALLFGATTVGDETSLGVSSKVGSATGDFQTLISTVGGPTPQIATALYNGQTFVHVDDDHAYSLTIPNQAPGLLRGTSEQGFQTQAVNVIDYSTSGAAIANITSKPIFAVCHAVGEDFDLSVYRRPPIFTITA